MWRFMRLLVKSSQRRVVSHHAVACEIAGGDLVQTAPSLRERLFVSRSAGRPGNAISTPLKPSELGLPDPA
jgi:hypothetical protein